jgi:preprotein translocase subunit SecY
LFDSVRGLWKLPDLRKKIIFTVLIIAVYRFGAAIPVPGVNVEILQKIFEKQQAGSILGLLNLLSGGALANFAIFSLGIMPYITASIIMQLLKVVIPKIDEWSKEGESGERKITQWTRFLTLGLAVVESIGYTFLFQKQLAESVGFAGFSGANKFLIVLTLVTGTVLIMWLGELITQEGIGNGMSILITINILSSFPGAFLQIGRTNAAFLGIVLVTFLIMVVAVVFMEQGQRRVPVQYAKRVVGRKMYGGSSTYIPLKLNSAGVIPIIFASSVLLFPGQIAQYFSGPVASFLQGVLKTDSPFYLSAFGLLIVFFTYFYTAITFNPKDTADNLKKYGGFIPGVRPGRATSEYINHILTRLTLPGAIFLAFLAIVPTIIFNSIDLQSAIRAFGGAAILIIVGVTLETVRQLESQLVMRHYEGFLK